jgi:hypothetical protein
VNLLVVIPTRDRPAQLRRALRSVARQERFPDRVVVVGETEADFGGARRAHPWAEFRFNSRTAGVSGSDNTALLDACEDVVAFLDDDDWWEADHLKRIEAGLAHADVAYSGLVRHARSGAEPQPIPTRVTVEDFLVGNPGVQGSNLALRVETYWRAGGFDEWLPSTIDRDLLIRILELPGVRVTSIDAHSVHHTTHGHSRLSDAGSARKILGLQRFEAKHRHRMSAGVLARARARARALFAWDGSPETVPVPEPRKASEPRPHAAPAQAPHASRLRDQPLVVGFSASSLEGARRTLAGLDWLAATGARIEQIVLIDCTDRADEISGLASSHPLAVTALVSHEVDSRAAAGIYGSAHARPETRRSIAFGRTVVHHELYKRMPAGGVAWVLDDDLDLRETRWEGSLIDGGGLRRAIGELCRHADVAVGGIHGDPPLRAGASIRTSLLDVVHAAQGGQGIARDGADLYHDLSALRTDHLEPPMPLPCTLAAAAIAAAVGRPGLRQAPARIPYGDPPARGGNTLVFTPECLRDYPNAAPWFGAGIARRADSLWLLQLRDLGPRRVGQASWRICVAPLSVAQRRLVDRPPSVRDLALDIDGWAFLRAMEHVRWQHEIDPAWFGRFEDAFVAARRQRLLVLRASSLRVQGLCDILAANHAALAALAQVEQTRSAFSTAEVDRLSRAEGDRVADALRFMREYADLARSYRAALPARPELAVRCALAGAGEESGVGAGASSREGGAR